MRTEPSILHLDLDAFFAAVEQRDKPSLRGRPVIVGGLGPRGVVSTASYEARVFGVRSAMRMAEARSRCPHAAFLAGRFTAYRNTSHEVMRVLHTLSPLVEPLSLDEAFVDLSAGRQQNLSVTAVAAIAQQVKRSITEVTGGLTASVGAATSKLVAKIASDLNKPDGLYVVPPGTERELLAPMPASRLPGVGPATGERLHRMGIRTVGALADADEDELVSALGQAHGHGLARLARAEDDRPVVSERESKSVSVEDTFDTDIVDPARLAMITDRLSARVCERLRHDRLSGRTITVKIRLYDFTTHTRSSTLSGPTDDVRVVTRIARRLLTEVDTSLGVRLLGVGLSGLADWVQDDLFSGEAPPDVLSEASSADPTLARHDLEQEDTSGESGVSGQAGHTGTRRTGNSADPGALTGAPGSIGVEGQPADAEGPTPVAVPDGTAPADTAPGGVLGGANAVPAAPAAPAAGRTAATWVPGADVFHAELGRGWVWGRGLGRVTVRFETAESAGGPVRTFAEDDPQLRPWTPAPVMGGTPDFASSVGDTSTRTDTTETEADDSEATRPSSTDARVGTDPAAEPETRYAEPPTSAEGM